MSGKRASIALAVLVLGGSVVAGAVGQSSNAPATQPSVHHRSRLVEPYSEMKTLSDSQKWKIEQIHLDANAKMAAIREKEQSDILALLSDAQKAELASIEDNKTVAEKERAAEKRKKAEMAAIAAATQAASSSGK